MAKCGGTYRTLIILAGFLVNGNGDLGASNGEVFIGSVSGGSFKQGALTVDAPGVTVGQESNSAPAGSNESALPQPNVDVGSATSDSTSFAADKITGGRYPNRSFSIGHGKDSVGTTGQANNDNRIGEGFRRGDQDPKYSSGNSGALPEPNVDVGGATSDSTSFAADKITGGRYPNLSFSIGHGKDSVGTTGQANNDNRIGEGFRRGDQEPNYISDNSGALPQPNVDVGGATSDSTSFAADKITGGRYPNRSFSTGHGKDSFGTTGQANNDNRIAEGFGSGNQGPKYSSGSSDALPQPNVDVNGATSDSTSFATNKINGGRYPNRSFSIGHGKDSVGTTGQANNDDTEAREESTGLKPNEEFNPNPGRSTGFDQNNDGRAPTSTFITPQKVPELKGKPAYIAIDLSQDTNSRPQVRNHPSQTSENDGSRLPFQSIIDIPPGTAIRSPNGRVKIGELSGGSFSPGTFAGWKPISSYN